MQRYKIKFGLFDEIHTVKLKADDRDHAIALARLKLKDRGVEHWSAIGIRAMTSEEE